MSKRLSMFSSRTEWDFRHSPLYELLQKVQGEGRTVIDLTESNPTRCGFWWPSGAFFDPASLEKSVFYDPNPLGLPVAREAIAHWYRRQKIEVDEESIVVTSGTSEAYSYLFRLLCEVGESVLVPKPGYPLFEYICALNDIRPLPYRLAYDGEWHPDAASLTQDQPVQPKALIAVHPNNPTGSFLKRDERDRLLAYLRDRSCPLISDEVFGEYAFGPDERRAGSFAGTTEMLTFVVNGLSKFAGLPQMKLAWIVVSGPDQERAEAIRRLEIIADTYLTVGTPIQHALPRLLEHAPVMTRNIGQRVKTNYGLMRSLFGGNSPARLYHCEGGWNAVVRLPATQSDAEWTAKLLEEYAVLVHPGHLFDFDESSCVVLSLLPKEDAFAEGVNGIFRMIQRELA